jgi:hypothetical protein
MSTPSDLRWTVAQVLLICLLVFSIASSLALAQNRNSLVCVGDFQLGIWGGYLTLHNWGDDGPFFNGILAVDRVVVSDLHRGWRGHLEARIVHYKGFDPLISIGINLLYVQGTMILAVMLLVTWSFWEKRLRRKPKI